ncbi:hypothetical protein RMN57_20600 [Kitasatospora sp. CM 4170]|uniref:Uncharacterized protein n=1 Tax=Kitasatospora aburaviensis TaxID=67265 RepID=A0ABW1F399_9ACTN|nr:hypothetical protein [Kitasatospora sp. CM 4170]WNM46927.1 hypothetical protein RMN57_20600 [Kitasatospora sp. CM 4170]
MTENPSLTRLTGRPNGPNCDDDDCPNVYATDRDTFVVQGDHFAALQVPEGESAVEIPRGVLEEAVRALGW